MTYHYGDGMADRRIPRIGAYTPPRPCDTEAPCDYCETHDEIPAFSFTAWLSGLWTGVGLTCFVLWIIHQSGHL